MAHLSASNCCSLEYFKPILSLTSDVILYAKIEVANVMAPGV